MSEKLELTSWWVMVTNSMTTTSYTFLNKYVQYQNTFSSQNYPFEIEMPKVIENDTFCELNYITE